MVRDEHPASGIADTLQETYGFGSAGASIIQRLAYPSERTVGCPGLAPGDCDEAGHHTDVVAPQLHQRQHTGVIGMAEGGAGAGEDGVAQGRVLGQCLYEPAMGQRHVVSHALEESIYT